MKLLHLRFSCLVRVTRRGRPSDWVVRPIRIMLQHWLSIHLIHFWVLCGHPIHHGLVSPSLSLPTLPRSSSFRQHQQGPSGQTAKNSSSTSPLFLLMKEERVRWAMLGMLGTQPRTLPKSLFGKRLAQLGHGRQVQPCFPVVFVPMPQSLISLSHFRNQQMEQYTAPHPILILLLSTYNPNRASFLSCNHVHSHTNIQQKALLRDFFRFLTDTERCIQTWSVVIHLTHPPALVHGYAILLVQISNCYFISWSYRTIEQNSVAYVSFLWKPKICYRKIPQAGIDGQSYCSIWPFYSVCACWCFCSCLSDAPVLSNTLPASN